MIHIGRLSHYTHAALLTKNLVSAHLGQIDIFYIVGIVGRFCVFLSEFVEEDLK